MFTTSLPVLGPGSQPDEAPPHLELPKGMATFERPAFPEGASGTAEARAVLLAFLDALRAWRRGEAPAPRLDLGGLAPAVLAAAAQVLAEGEVSAVVSRGEEGSLRIDETAFAGVWNVRALRRDGTVERHVLEAGAIPADVVAARAAAARAVPVPPEVPGLMNAPAVLREVLARSAERAGDAAHVVNLTLLPMTPEDLAWLHGALGTGPVAIHARGYGSCRITGTALADVWWVQYFNSTGALILDTLEVVDVPAAALAADEDLDATVARLGEWLAELAEA